MRRFTGTKEFLNKPPVLNLAKSVGELWEQLHLDVDSDCKENNLGGTRNECDDNGKESKL